MADKGDSDGLDPAIDPELLAKAEQAVAALSDNFSAAVLNDISELRDLIDALDSGAADADSVARIFDIAHDMHGQGGSFGYPLISRIGAALCRFVETRNVTAADGAALRIFADAAAAIAGGNLSGDDDTVARTTVNELEALATRAAD